MKLDVEDRFWNKVRIGDGCWEWTRSVNTDGYAQLTFDGKTRRASRVVLGLCGTVIPEGMHVLHRCDNRRCVRPGHLFLGTHQDNMDDRGAKGRSRGGSNPGSRHPASKLTELDVLSIRSRVYAGETQRSVSAAFGISNQHISDIIARKVWRHV